MGSKIGTIYALNLQSSDSLTLWKNDNKALVSLIWLNSKGFHITVDNRNSASLQNSTGELTGSSGSENSTEVYFYRYMSNSKGETARSTY